MADRSLLMVAKIGTITLGPIGKLEHVLYVPKLFRRLVSIQQIASLIPYKIEFDGTHAFLCDKVQWWRLGLARVHDGLNNLPISEAVKSSSKHIVTAAL